MTPWWTVGGVLLLTLAMCYCVTRAPVLAAIASGEGGQMDEDDADVDPTMQIPSGNDDDGNVARGARG